MTIRYYRHMIDHVHPGEDRSGRGIGSWRGVWPSRSGQARHLREALQRLVPEPILEAIQTRHEDDLVRHLTEHLALDESWRAFLRDIVDPLSSREV